jgi:hypothetical protein
MSYHEAKQSQIFNKYGAFFAFSKKQFNRQKQDNVRYLSFGGGLIVPADNVKPLHAELDALYEKSAEQDITDNGIKKIIHRELANHECQISGDYECVVDLLGGYHNITKEQIDAEYPHFYQNCIDNDCF